jgi:ubiquinone/menaquinone biosynthesis C-methylase UbiE
MTDICPSRPIGFRGKISIIKSIWKALLKLWKRSTILSPLPIRTVDDSHLTSTDLYWGQHTVNSTPFKSTAASLSYLEWRFEEYPMFRELMQLYGGHEDQIILDYGCGPGNDLVGFLVYSKAKKVIGIDVSLKALDLAAGRLALHNIDPARIELIRTTDSNTTIPVPDDSVDYIYCGGVLHHTSDPEAILQEFYRVLRLGSQACVMVYNRNSLWLHLYTAYDKMVLKKAFPNLSLEEAFSKNTDGEACPISRCYAPENFIAICKQAGFPRVEFVGGYLSLRELSLLKDLGRKAIEDNYLGTEHREFLRRITYDKKGYPMYQRRHAGIGGVYRLFKV